MFLDPQTPQYKTTIPHESQLMQQGYKPYCTAPEEYRFLSEHALRKIGQLNMRDQIISKEHEISNCPGIVIGKPLQSASLIPPAGTTRILD